MGRRGFSGEGMKKEVKCSKQYLLGKKAADESAGGVSNDVR